MTGPTQDINEETIRAVLAGLADAIPQGTAAPDAALQARNLAALTTASTAMSETYLSLAREQIAAAGAALTSETPAEAATAWLEQMAEAAEQAGAALQARLLAELANSNRTKT